MTVYFQADGNSVVFVSVPADDELYVAADSGGDPDSVDHQQCPLV